MHVILLYFNVLCLYYITLEYNFLVRRLVISSIIPICAYNENGKFARHWCVCVCAVCTHLRILKSNEVEIMGFFDARLCVIMSFWNQRHYSSHQNPLSNFDWLNSVGTKLVHLIRIDYISKSSLEIFSNIRSGILNVKHSLWHTHCRIHTLKYTTDIFMKLDL